MPTSKIRTPVEPGKIYHIYNRGNNYAEVFLQENDYQLFLDKMKFYLQDICSFYAYALLPNHYHLLLRLNEKSLGSAFTTQFAKFILSYTNLVNFREKRCGGIFLSSFRRINVDQENYLKRLVYYILHNPVKHNLTGNYKTYPYSSFQDLISEKSTVVNSEEVISWFGSLDELLIYLDFLDNENLIQSYCLENN
jgi:REP element-mobilizing transposase RayT